MSSQPVRIRPAEDRDCAELASIIRELGYFSSLIESESEAETASRVSRQLGLCQVDHSHTVLVAEVDGAAHGYISAHWMPDLWGYTDGYISELFVRESARGTGLGGALLEAVEREGRRRGANRLLLFNRKIRESYQRGFYQKHGWSEREDVAFMMKMLDSAQPDAAPPPVLPGT